MSTSGGSGGGTNLAPSGTYVATIPAYGLPGFESTAQGDDTHGWLGLIANATNGEVVVGYGHAGQKFVDIFATTDGGEVDLGSDSGALAQLRAVADTQLNLTQPAGQTSSPLIVLNSADAHLLEVLAAGALQMLEQTDPAAGAANTARLYARDNGAAKTQIVVRFPTGAVQVIATEP